MLNISQRLKRAEKLAARERQLVFDKFPLLFTLLVTIGAIATFSGLNKLIEQIGWLNRNPLILLGFGVAILVLTGTLYKKLR